MTPTVTAVLVASVAIVGCILPTTYLLFRLTAELRTQREEISSLKATILRTGGELKESVEKSKLKVKA